MGNWLGQLAPQLQQAQSTDAYRRRREINSAQGPSVSVDGRRMLNFSSNDYLALANHPQVVEAFTDAAGRYGVGSGASHLVVGHHALHHQLECALADYTGRQRALVFSSGYMANLGLLQALLGKGDSLFQDKLNHASLIDGGLACGAKQLRYRHKDIEHLESLLQKHGQGRAMLVTDGVFSMDGDLAPLAQLATLADRYKAVLMVDDAHGFGVLGETGAGSAQYAHLNQHQVPILMGTLGKALGVAGAFIAGSNDLIETLVQSARNYTYTTALPAACAAATLAALRISRSEPQRREHLQSLLKQFKSGCQSRGIPLPVGEAPLTPIVPIIVGSNQRALALSNYLGRHDMLAIAIRPPTVPLGSARLRISFSAGHSADDVTSLLNVLESGCKEIGALF
ncbi:MAG: 8-amino-7-oxononanoate synthase [Pseudomonadales bacterium]|nr:8-amino-7-oxononanoate synthase [Pseudomonadales bacterium]